MNFRKGSAREEPEINLIPFIDVLLVILIFLMISTTFSRFAALQITLPSAQAEKLMEQPLEINIVIDAKGRYAINDRQIAYSDPAGLSEQLLQVAGPPSPDRPEPMVIINADAMATHQTVINVLEAARLAGLARVTFAAQSTGR